MAETLEPTPFSGRGAGLPLEPMGIPRLADRTLYFLRRNFVPLILFIGVINLVPLIFQTIAATAASIDVALGLLLLYGNSIFQLVLSTFLLIPLQIGGIAIALRHFVVDGRQVALSEMLAEVGREAGGLIRMGVVSAVVSAVLLLTLLLPPVGIVLLSLYSYVYFLGVFVVLYERKPPIEALRRGWLLMRDDLWRTVRIAILTALVSWLVGFALGVGIIGLFAIVDPMGNEWIVQVLSGVATFFTNLITTPLIFSLVGLYYFDLRVRHEGLDLSIAAARAAGEPANLTASPSGNIPLLNDAARRTLMVLSAIVTGLGLFLCGCVGLIAVLSV